MFELALILLATGKGLDMARGGREAAGSPAGKNTCTPHHCRGAMHTMQERQKLHSLIPSTAKRSKRRPRPTWRDQFGSKKFTPMTDRNHADHIPHPQGAPTVIM